MKNLYQGVRIEKFKYITIIYTPTIESVKLMVQEHYDIPEYNDTLFLINTVSEWYFHHEPQHRCIYYNLEHNADIDIADKKKLNQYLKDNGVTEVWSTEPNCEVFDIDLGVRFMPVRYTTYIKKQEISKPKFFDLAFVGILGSDKYAPRRNKFFEQYIGNPFLDFSVKILNGHLLNELQDEFANCKFILDSHRNYKHNMQNQVRIFEHICMGHTVLSEKSDYNMFPGLIYEWENIEELNDLVHTIQPEDFSEKYKELTYSNEAYENYRHALLSSYYDKWTVEYFDACGIKRYDVINRLIKAFNYKSYLEIGVYCGENFVKIECENKVSVDPEQYGYTTNQMTSDEYFEQLPEDVKFDIIFIDGLHLWEFCYRDINNSLKHLSPNGIIICHDMNPFYQMYASRVGCANLWNGDVWKAFAKVRSERNDIFSCMIEDCDFGLGIITFGNQKPIELGKSVEDLTYFGDFVPNKPYLMNTTKIKDFIERNGL